MEKNRLLITGSQGLIGRILKLRLAASYDIYGLDKDCPPTVTNLMAADIADFHQVMHVFHAFAPIHYVVHLAADPNHETTWESACRNNIHGTWNVFSAANHLRVHRIIFASSNHVTGAYEGDPPSLHLQASRSAIRVDDPIRPDGPYGISKATGEAIARFFYDYHKLEAVCVRIGSVLKDDDPTHDERHQSTWLSHADCGQLFAKALGAKETFPGFGIYYGVSDNDKRFWDYSNAQKEIGYVPEDNAAHRIDMKGHSGYR